MVPAIKNGPKAILLFNFFFAAKISMTPTMAPVKKAINIAIIIFGKPSKKPIKKANFTSPKPIPFPLVIINKLKKNRQAKIALGNMEKSSMAVYL